MGSRAGYKLMLEDVRLRQQAWFWEEEMLDEIASSPIKAWEY